MPQRMLRVDRHKHDAAITIFKLVEAILESKNLSRTDETERCRYEHDHKPWSIWMRFLALDGRVYVGVYRDICDDAIDDRLAFKVWGFVSYADLT